MGAGGLFFQKPFLRGKVHIFQQNLSGGGGHHFFDKI